MFGDGPLAIGSYESGCEIDGVAYAAGVLTLNGQCTQEGEDMPGDSRITIYDPQTIALALPDQEGAGWLLKACGR